LIIKSRRSRQKHQKQGLGTKSVQKVSKSFQSARAQRRK
jgi:hypothetical protein